MQTQQDCAFFLSVLWEQSRVECGIQVASSQFLQLMFQQNTNSGLGSRKGQAEGQSLEEAEKGFLFQLPGKSFQLRGHRYEFCFSPGVPRAANDSSIFCIFAFRKLSIQREHRLLIAILSRMACHIITLFFVSCQTLVWACYRSIHIYMYRQQVQEFVLQIYLVCSSVSLVDQNNIFFNCLCSNNFDILFYLFIFYMCMYIVCMHEYVHAWKGQRATLCSWVSFLGIVSWILFVCFVCFMSQILSLVQNLEIDQSGWPLSPSGQTLSSFSCVSLSNCLVMWILGIELRPSCLNGKPFT